MLSSLLTVARIASVGTATLAVVAMLSLDALTRTPLFAMKALFTARKAKSIMKRYNMFLAVSFYNIDPFSKPCNPNPNQSSAGHAVHKPLFSETNLGGGTHGSEMKSTSLQGVVVTHIL